MRSARSLPAGEGGYITLDFIFATVLIAGMFTACFAICLTLTMVEVAQYITFSTARVYFGGHVSAAAQRQLAMQKFQQLATQQPFRQLFFEENSLFSLSQPTIGDFNSEFPFDSDPAQDNLTFIGARSRFRAKVLEFNIPIWGSVQAPDGDGFYANVSTYLSREPATDECIDVNSGRFSALRRLDGSYGQGLRFPEKYVLVTDNGC